MKFELPELHRGVQGRGGRGAGGGVSHHNKSTFRMITVGEIGDIVCYANYCSIEDIMLGCQAPQVGDGLAIYVLANARSAS